MLSKVSHFGKKENLRRTLMRFFKLLRIVNDRSVIYIIIKHLRNS